MRATSKGTRAALGEATAAGVGMCLFGVFAHSGWPWAALSGVGLLTAGVCLWRAALTAPSLAATFGVARLQGKTGLYLVLGCGLGVVLGMANRAGVGWTLVPTDLNVFAPVAALIGAAEELLYRGYLQGRLRPVGRFGAVVLAALSHTAYKSGLFVSPPVPVDVPWLAFSVFTFLGGVLFGALREGSGNVLPPVAAHVAFEIVVYGQFTQAPWWVW